jgi:hypothetical protein
MKPDHHEDGFSGPWHAHPIMRAALLAGALTGEAEDLQQRIARKAYELYEQSGRIEGRDLENWLEAERVIGQRVSLAGGRVESSTQ